jgi:hypothetical protein
MEKIITALSSRTVWTVVVMVIVNGVPAVTSMVPETYVPVVNLALGILAAYFRVNPRV